MRISFLLSQSGGKKFLLYIFFVFGGIFPLWNFSQLKAQIAEEDITSDAWNAKMMPDGRISLSLDLPASSHAYPVSCGPVSAKVDVYPETKMEYNELSGENEPTYVGPGTFIWILSHSEMSSVSVHWQICKNGICFIPQSASINVQGVSIDEQKRNAKDKVDNDIKHSVWESLQIIQSADGFMNVSQFEKFLLGENNPSFFNLDGKNLLLMIVIAILGGISMNFTPCVLPLFPVNLAMIGTTNKRSSERIARGCIYGSGIVVAYGFMGIFSLFLGTTFGVIDSNWFFNFCIACVFVVLAISLFDFFSIDFSRYSAHIRMPKNTSYIGVFLMGSLSAILAGACVAPILIATLLQATKMISHHDYSGVILPFAVGLGMALPWPFIAWLTSRRIFFHYGKWSLRIKHSLGILIFALGIYYFYLSFELYENQIQTHKNQMGDIEIAPIVKSIQNAVDLSKETRQPIFLDFTAEWCKNCKIMEATVFTDEKIKQKLQDYILVTVHVDNPSEEEISSLLEYFQVKGLPAFRIVMEK